MTGGAPVAGVGRQCQVPAGLDVVGEAVVAVVQVGVECGDAGVGVGVAEEAFGDADQPVVLGHPVAQHSDGVARLPRRGLQMVWGRRRSGRGTGGGLGGHGRDCVNRRRWRGGLRGRTGDSGRGGADEAGGDAVQWGGQPDAGGPDPADRRVHLDRDDVGEHRPPAPTP